MSNTRKPSTRKPRRKTLDFDAIAAKKAKVIGELPFIKIGGKKYEIAPTLPLAVTDYFAENSSFDEETGDVRVLVNDMKMLLEVVFGAEAWAEIRQVIDERMVPDLFGEVFKTYGQSVGESSASGAS